MLVCLNLLVGFSALTRRHEPPSHQVRTVAATGSLPGLRVASTNESHRTLELLGLTTTTVVAPPPTTAPPATTTTEPAPTTTVPPPTVPPTTLAPSPPTTAQAPAPAAVGIPQDPQFWWWLANCESGNGVGSSNQYQFEGGTGAKMGISGGEPLAVQTAAAQRWAAILVSQGTSPGSRSGWPNCWWVALAHVGG
jgi:hypothetical protein